MYITAGTVHSVISCPTLVHILFMVYIRRRWLVYETSRQYGKRIRIRPSYEHFSHTPCFVHRVDAEPHVFREGILVRFSVYTIVPYANRGCSTIQTMYEVWHWRMSCRIQNLIYECHEMSSMFWYKKILIWLLLAFEWRGKLIIFSLLYSNLFNLFHISVWVIMFKCSIIR